MQVISTKLILHTQKRKAMYRYTFSVRNSQHNAYSCYAMLCRAGYTVEPAFVTNSLPVRI